MGFEERVFKEEKKKFMHTTKKMEFAVGKDRREEKRRENTRKNK